MTESAYSIFKRPILIDKDEPFLEGVKTKFQAQVHYTPNLAQEINLSRIQRYCLCVLTPQLGNYRTTSSSEVEHRGRELEQWDKPLCASVPALHGSIGSDRRDKLSFNGRGLALPGYWI